MSQFTTRPEIVGTFGVATSTHWLASAVGFGILEKGGNAFDAAVAMGFVLQVVEPHLCGPAGDMPAIFYSAKTGKTEVLCGQGTAPAGATIEAYKDQGLDLIPGSGLLATVIPGSFDAWMLMLRDHGTLSVREALEPAIYYAGSGHPLLPRVAATIAELGEFFEKEWPTSAETWLPGGQAPEAGKLFRNPQLAETWRRRGFRSGKQIGPRGSDRRGPRRLLPGLRGGGHRRLPAHRGSHGCQRGKTQWRADSGRHGQLAGKLRRAADLRLS